MQDSAPGPETGNGRPSSGRARPGLRQALTVLQHRNYRHLYVANLISALGGQFSMMANLWLIYQLTQSPLLLGLSGLARSVPMVAMSLVGGVVADRVDRKKLLVITQTINGLLSVALGLLTLSGHIAPWHIYLTTFIHGAVQSLGQPTRMAIVPSLVPRPQLMNAIALNSTVWQSTNIVGPALAGLSIALLGVPASYLWSGLAQVGSIVSLTRIQLPPAEDRPRMPALQSLVEGMSFVRSHAAILPLLGLDVGITLFGSYYALWPIIATNLGVGPQGMGVLQSAPAIGSIAGAAVLMSVGGLRYPGVVAVGSVLVFCLALVGLAHSPAFLLSILFASLLGFCDSLQGVTRSTVIQSIVPDHLRGRVSSLQTMLVQGGPGFGQVWSGAMASVLGVAGAFTLGAGLAAALALGLIARYRELRSADLGQRVEPVSSAERLPVGPSTG